MDARLHEMARGHVLRRPGYCSMCAEERVSLVTSCGCYERLSYTRSPAFPFPDFRLSLSLPSHPLISSFASMTYRALIFAASSQPTTAACSTSLPRSQKAASSMFPRRHLLTAVCARPTRFPIDCSRKCVRGGGINAHLLALCVCAPTGSQGPPPLPADEGPRLAGTESAPRVPFPTAPAHPQEMGILATCLRG